MPPVTDPMNDAAIDKYLDGVESSLQDLKNTLHQTAKTPDPDGSETKTHDALLRFRQAVSGLDDAVMHRIHKGSFD